MYGGLKCSHLGSSFLWAESGDSVGPMLPGGWQVVLPQLQATEHIDELQNDGPSSPAEPHREASCPSPGGVGHTQQPSVLLVQVLFAQIPPNKLQDTKPSIMSHCLYPKSPIC